MSEKVWGFLSTEKETTWDGGGGVAPQLTALGAIAALVDHATIVREKVVGPADAESGEEAEET